MKFNDIEELEDAGFEGFESIASLMQNRCASLPPEQGVYMVLNPGRKKRLSANSAGPAYHNGKPLIYSMAELEKNWVENTIVLYIGKTSETLCKRVKTYIDFGRGKDVPHRGGRMIWQLENHQELLFCHKSLTDSESPKRVEAELIHEFTCHYNNYMPFANLTKPRLTNRV